jgi:hypothetical protein
MPDKAVAFAIRLGLFSNTALAIEIAVSKFEL